MWRPPSNRTRSEIRRTLSTVKSLVSCRNCDLSWSPPPTIKLRFWSVLTGDDCVSSRLNEFENKNSGRREFSRSRKLKILLILDSSGEKSWKEKSRSRRPTTESWLKILAKWVSVMVSSARRNGRVQTGQTCNALEATGRLWPLAKLCSHFLAACPRSQI